MKRRIGMILALALLLQAMPAAAMELPEEESVQAQEEVLPIEQSAKVQEEALSAEQAVQAQEEALPAEQSVQVQQEESLGEETTQEGQEPAGAPEEGAETEETPKEEALPYLAAGEKKVKEIGKVELYFSPPKCGHAPEDPEGDCYTTGVTLKEAHWAASWSNDSCSLQTEPFVGGEVYTVWFVLEAEEGYVFTDETIVPLYKGEEDGTIDVRPLQADSHRLAFAAEIVAEHDFDYDNEIRVEATCIKPGHVIVHCLGDPSHVDEYDLEDPDAHVWGDWIVETEPAMDHEGERYRTCTLCGKEERETLPRETLPYSEVYEPNTSWSMAATIAWRSDQKALEVAGAGERPATVFVWLDRDLKVYDRDGKLLSEDIGSYVAATSPTVIPAFYIRDRETADALKAWIPDNGLRDCFVVSDPAGSDLVRDVADLVHVRGMLDYTEVKNPDRKALLDMVASTNGAHGKVILLSQEAASRENVRLLQSLASTVWVRSDTDLRSLVTLYTRGVNGVVVDEFDRALGAEELFQDEKPSLLRIPFIIGHRGDPSQYVENTLDSAKGAYQGGADSVENDIHLSTDGKLFIYHDDTGDRLMILKGTVEEYADLENYSYAELTEYPLDWERIPKANEVSADRSRQGTLYGQEEEKEYYLPTLEDYIKAFKGKDLIHDTEIKSYNPAIIPVYKEMVDSYDAWDQFFTITFNGEILDAIYRDYPEISIGALGMAFFTDVEYPMLESVVEEKGMAEALKQLFGVVDRWNATCNPVADLMTDDILEAIRHRGLTVWPWTYTEKTYFTRDYLRAVTGLTTDFPWYASDLLVEIPFADLTAASESAVKKPVGITQSGEEKPLEKAELVKLQDLEDGSQLMIWRCQTSLTLDGENCGDYYVYSEPFVLRLRKEEAASGDKETGGNGQKKETTSAVKTGDETGAPVLVLLFLFSFLGMACCRAFYRRRA